MRISMFFLFALSILFFNYSVYSQWRSTDSTLYPRYWHSAVKLNDGRVLVTGGRINSTAIFSCEIFDPQSESWTEVTPMLFPHSGHTSVLLPNNKVLVAGGDNLICELYDPELNAWQLTDELIINPYYFNHWHGVLSSEGKYFLINYPDEPVEIRAQIYDYQTGLWTVSGPLDSISWDFSVSQIHESIMAAGGMWGVRNCEIFDRNTNSWQEIAKMNEGRSSFTATKLNNGNILVTGGESYRGSSLHPKESCEIYNTSTQVWNYVNSMNYARIDHQAILLSNGKVMVVGGWYTWGSPHKQTEIYSPYINTWEYTGDILYPRDSFTLTELNDSSILLVGGAYQFYSYQEIDSLICEIFEYNPTGVEDNLIIFETDSYELSQNFPNPFNPSTTIKYQLPEMSFVTIKVYDILGREVATLVNEEKPAGSYEVEFNSHSVEGRKLPAGRQSLTSGIYFYQLKVGAYSETKKMVLLK